jgi:hypothetical protein
MYLPWGRGQKFAKISTLVFTPWLSTTQVFLGVFQLIATDPELIVGTFIGGGGGGAALRWQKIRSVFRELRRVLGQANLR